MAAELHTEGLQYILETAVSEVQSVPAALYLGWCTDTSLPENATLGDQTELSGNGYARVAFNTDNTDWTSAAYSTDGWKVTGKSGVFAASGGAWSTAYTWFLASTSDDTGVLIASGPINSGSGIALPDGENYKVAPVIQLTIVHYWQIEGLQYLLEVAFSEEQSVPANFYVGLCEDTSLADDASLGDQTELSGNGYARQTIASSSADFFSTGAGDNDRMLIGEEVSFEADGAAWNLARTAFLATSSDDSGKLMASWPLNAGAGYALPDGQVLDVVPVLQLNG